LCCRQSYSYSIDGSTFTPLSPEQIISPLIISGLSNGIDYTLYVKAINIAGSSIASTPIIYSSIPSSFSPTSFAGPTFWLDSLAASSVILSGSNVIAWNDTSGSGNHFTASGGTITYGNTGKINNRPAIHFTTGFPTVTRLSRTLALSSGVNYFSIFMVLSQTGVSGTGSNSHLFNSSDTTLSIQNLTDTSSNLIVRAGSFSNNSGKNIVTTPPTVALISYIAGNSAALFLNGFTTNISNATTPVVGTSLPWSISGTGFLGSFGEIICYPSALPAENRQRVEGYLAWKWGLQSNLSTNNPFSLYPPDGLITPPGIPTMQTIVGGNSNGYVYFSPGSGTVNGYQYSINNGVTYSTILPLSIISPLVINGLTNAIIATIQIRGFNQGGLSSGTTRDTKYNISPNNCNYTPPFFFIDPTNPSCYSGTGSNIFNVGSNGTQATGSAIRGSFAYELGSNISNNVFKLTGGYIRVLIPNNTTYLNNTVAFTAWVYPSSTNSTMNTIYASGNMAFGWNSISTNDGCLVGVSGIGGTVVYSKSIPNTIIQNTWQHITLITDGGTNSMVFCLNGIPVRMVNAASSGTSINLGHAIGSASVNAASNVMFGQIGAFYINTNATSKILISQVLNDFNTTRANYGV